MNKHRTDNKTYLDKLIEVYVEICVSLVSIGLFILIVGYVANKFINAF